ncbi:MAG: 6-carboxytetrahydropterin synthase QueD [Calditrichae bacterium]|nr:6-carboxytetrahydropterin synthase QueD [Calditrichota bacterium]MCB9058845.1 6-carboxytetrahydropterin synthase QueD [Calditrichia bacterium]
MYRLSTKKMISAAHILHGYDGPCSRLHGHNWNVKIDVLSDYLDKVGLSIDFMDLDDLLWQVIGRFDHRHFNDIAPFDKMNPTAENIARYFFDEIKEKLPKHVKLEKITIWETEEYLVEYFENH